MIPSRQSALVASKWFRCCTSSISTAATCLQRDSTGQVHSEATGRSVPFGCTLQPTITPRMCRLPRTLAITNHTPGRSSSTSEVATHCLLLGTTDLSRMCLARHKHGLANWKDRASLLCHVHSWSLLPFSKTLCLYRSSSFPHMVVASLCRLLPTAT